MIKKYFVYAYFNNNLGDDLFIKTLCEKFPNYKFVVYAGSANYINIFSQIHNLKIYTNESKFVINTKKILRKIKRRNKNRDNIRYILSLFCNGCITIGGSLFMQPSIDWNNHCQSYELRRIRNKPNYIMGVNFGPFKEIDFVEAYKKIFRKYTDICFRDLYSYNLFKDLKNVRFAPDILFDLNYEKESEKIKQVAISVINLSIRDELKHYEQSYKEMLIKIIMFHVSKNYHVKLFSFCKPEGDEEIIEAIMEYLNEEDKQSISVCYYRDSMDFVLKELQKSEFIIATRFHCMILGWLFQIPVFPIVYSAKMLNVIEEMNFKGNYIDIKNIHTLTMEEVNYNLLNNVCLDISAVRKEATLHFEALENNRK